MSRIMHVICTGSERLCSKRKSSSHDGEKDNKGILSFIIHMEKGLGLSQCNKLYSMINSKHCNVYL